jgi:hypothetical protein
VRGRFRHCSAACLPVTGHPRQLATESGLEQGDCFVNIVRGNLGAQHASVDVQVALSDHRSGHRRIVRPTEPHPATQDRLIRVPTERGKLRLRLFPGAGGNVVTGHDFDIGHARSAPSVMLPPPCQGSRHTRDTRRLV